MQLLSFSLRSLLLLASLSPAALVAQAPAPIAPPGLLLATNQFANTLSFIDPNSGKEIAVLPEQHITGHELATTPDGHTVFIPVYGNSGVGKPGTDGHEILAVDVPSRRITHVIDLGHGVRPHQPVFNRADGLLYVTAELDNAVDVIDPATFKVVGHIPTGSPQSHMLVLSPDGHTGYTANVSTGTVSVLDLQKRTLLAKIQAAQQIQRITISTDGSLLFTSDVLKPELIVIDTKTRAVKTRVPLPTQGYGAAATRDGRSLLLTLPNNNVVGVIDLHTLSLVRTIPTPAGPQAVLLRPDGHAYVSCMHDRRIAAIRTDTFTVWQTIMAGDGVDGMAWANPVR